MGEPAYLRLRQVCLVAPQLEPVVDAVRAIFGLEVCHRDPGVAAFGLENALFVFGQAFVEIVAPLREGTAAGRFLQRGGGQGGYMAIFDCHDPERRRAHARALGLRIACELQAPGYWGTQLHPADCRAAMLEFDRSEGGAALDGAYWPAGPHWQGFARPDRAAGVPCITLHSPDPAGLAAHWARVMDLPLRQAADGMPLLRFDLGAARFLAAPAAPAASAGPAERLAAMDVAVPDPAATVRAATAAGCAVEGDGFCLAGVCWRPVAST